jgi:hypothetical protein
LNKVSGQSEMPFSELFNLAQDERFKEIDRNYVLDSLEQDGYIFEFQPDVFKFTSPILKHWWSRHANRNL